MCAKILTVTSQPSGFLSEEELALEKVVVEPRGAPRRDRLFPRAGSRWRCVPPFARLGKWLGICNFRGAEDEGGNMREGNLELRERLK